MDVKSVAVVTGASQGIGKATALRLARDFAAVLLVARDKENLETAAREVRSAGVETEFLAADLREPQAAETVVKGPMHANNLNRTNADRPGVDLSAFFSAKVAKKEEDAVKRREFLSVISSASFAATLGCSLADFARAQDSAPADGKAIDTGSFAGSQVAVAGNTIYVRRYGEGPAILMVHGFPRTSLMWRHLAPQLAENHTVICADLRAYGRSGTPASTDDHIPYSKRAMAKELVDVMMKLGFPSFTLIGHDRGGRVSYRMALDHPKSVERLAVFDVIPIYEAWSRADARFAQTYWPWILLSQKQPLPESYLLGAPEAVYRNPFGQGSFGAEILDEYVSNYRDPARVHGICEEYRAAATIDVEHDRADKDASRKIECPMLHLWAEGGPLDTFYAKEGGPLGIWRQWAPRAHGQAMKGGHFFPEENPNDTAALIKQFLTV